MAASSEMQVCRRKWAETTFPTFCSEKPGFRPKQFILGTGLPALLASSFHQTQPGVVSFLLLYDEMENVADTFFLKTLFFSQHKCTQSMITQGIFNQGIITQEKVTQSNIIQEGLYIVRLARVH